MKARNLTAIAVVATGAVALGAPAAFAQAPDVSGVNGGLDKLGSIGKSAKKQARAAHHSAFQKRTGADIKRLGDNVRDLRKKDDEITFTISSIVGTITPILTQLGTAATSYADFEYGVVQLYANTAPIAGAFAATPRIDPTVEQSTVTARFPCLPTAAGAPNTCDSGDTLNAKVAIRSANPTTNIEKSDYKCRLQASQEGTVKWAATLKSGSPFLAISELSPLTPPDPKTENTFPAAQASSDKVTDMFTATTSVTQDVLLQQASSVGSFTVDTGVTLPGPTAGKGMLSVTLSCLKSPK